MSLLACAMGKFFAQLRTEPRETEASRRWPKGLSELNRNLENIVAEALYAWEQKAFAQHGRPVTFVGYA